MKSFAKSCLRHLILLATVGVSLFAAAKSVSGVSLGFYLSDTTLNYKFADSTTAQYSGVSGVTEFQAPIYERDRFRFGGTLSYRYMELRNKSISETQFAAHSGFGVGLQVTYRFLLLGVDYHSIHAKDFLTGPGSTNYSYSYMSSASYAGLIWQIGALGIGAIYSTGKASLSPSTFTNQGPAEMTEQLIGLRLNYNFRTGTKQFFRGLLKK